MAGGENARRVPPHSMAAEQAVLGALLLDARALDVVAPLLKPADFYSRQHAAIYQAAQQLVADGQPVDVVTVFERLRGSADMEAPAEWLAYINDLTAHVAGSQGAAGHAAIVAGKSRLRQLLAVGMDLAEQAMAADSPDALTRLADGAVTRLLDLQAGAAGDDAPRLLSELLAPWLDLLQQRADGHTTAVSIGLADCDRVLGGGPEPGDLVVLASRPSMGKSALALKITRAFGMAGPVLACTMEDSATMLLNRHVASTGRANLADVRRPPAENDAFWVKVTEGVEALQGLPIWVDDRAALSPADIRRKAQWVKQRTGKLVAVVVDYLQLMDDGGGESRAYEITRMARDLKRLAKDLKCVVLVLSQLNREADKVEGPPRIDHLAEGGGIEQAADIIGLLWRQARRKPTPENKHKAQIEFVKNKNGPTDTVQLFFDGATQRFEDAFNEGSYAGA
jgi:replicative DNA helicase